MQHHHIPCSYCCLQQILSIGSGITCTYLCFFYDHFPWFLNLPIFNICHIHYNIYFLWQQSSAPFSFLVMIEGGFSCLLIFWLYLTKIWDLTAARRSYFCLFNFFTTTTLYYCHDNFFILFLVATSSFYFYLRLFFI